VGGSAKRNGCDGRRERNGGEPDARAAGSAPRHRIEVGAAVARVGGRTRKFRPQEIRNSAAAAVRRARIQKKYSDLREVVDLDASELQLWEFTQFLHVVRNIT
jgi:hypothetical protein